MAKVPRLTYDEALTLTRGELIDRLYAQGLQHGPYDDYPDRTRIMRLIDVGAVLADTIRLLEGRRHGPSYLEQRPDPADAE